MSKCIYWDNVLKRFPRFYRLNQMCTFQCTKKSFRNTQSYVCVCSAAFCILYMLVDVDDFLYVFSSILFVTVFRTLHTYTDVYSRNPTTTTRREKKSMCVCLWDIHYSHIMRSVTSLASFTNAFVRERVSFIHKHASCMHVFVFVCVCVVLASPV